MLVLTRRQGGKIMIGDSITIQVAGIGRHIVRLAIEAPPEVAIMREELVGRNGNGRPRNFGELCPACAACPCICVPGEKEVAS